MKKRVLCAALALSALASFAAAEDSAPFKVRELPLTCAGSPSISRMGDSLLDLALGILFGDTAYISLNFPFLYQWDTGTSHVYADYGGNSSWSCNWGIGLDMTYLVTPRTGFHISADFYLPQSQLGSSSGWGRGLNKTYGIDSNWDSTWGFSFFTGPSLAILRSERILLAASPGVHVAAFFSDHGPYSVSSAIFGLGANVEFDLIFARLFFIRAALDLTFDFIGIKTVSFSGMELSSGDTSGLILTIVPSIGVGIWL